MVDVTTALESTQSAQQCSVYDVVICGAGPVGLFLACELALAKCSVLILEKAESASSPLKQFPFGIRGLSAPSIEALYRRGLLGDLELHKRLKNPHKTSVTEGPRRQVGHFAGIPFYEGDVDRSQWEYRLPSSTETSLLTSMEEMESVLCRRAEALGVEIKRGLGVTDFQQSADGVTVLAGERSFPGKWLVGCDGSRSVVRKAGGFEFAGTEPEFTGYSAQVDIADPEKLTPGRVLTATGMYLQSQPGYVVMAEFDGGAGHSGEPVTLEQVQGVLRRVSDTDVTISALHAATTWTDRARQATSYRNGRVFLAGDAAHIHSPLGGQGLNLGLGDAMNLGWKLAATIHEKAADGLLDSYEMERHPLGVRVLDWSRAQVAIMRPGPASRALNAIVRDLMSTRDGATYMAAKVWGVHTRYDLGGGHDLVGHNVPNFEFEDGSRIGEFMQDGRGILLDFEGNVSFRDLAGEFGELVKYVSGRAKEQFGLSALLIRPDGMIAWASDNEPNCGEFRKAAARWTAYLRAERPR
jgi:2-polyprenyl-6-methoxyphenol hydroxylase-like FAD-dependent oxidoreductase